MSRPSDAAIAAGKKSVIMTQGSNEDIAYYAICAAYDQIRADILAEKKP